MAHGARRPRIGLLATVARRYRRRKAARTLRDCGRVVELHGHRYPTITTVPLLSVGLVPLLPHEHYARATTPSSSTSAASASSSTSAAPSTTTSSSATAHRVIVGDVAVRGPWPIREGGNGHDGLVIRLNVLALVVRFKT